MDYGLEGMSREELIEEIILLRKSENKLEKTLDEIQALLK